MDWLRRKFKNSSKKDGDASEDKGKEQEEQPNKLGNTVSQHTQ